MVKGIQIVQIKGQTLYQGEIEQQQHSVNTLTLDFWKAFPEALSKFNQTLYIKTPFVLKHFSDGSFIVLLWRKKSEP